MANDMLRVWKYAAHTHTQTYLIYNFFTGGLPLFSEVLIKKSGVVRSLPFYIISTLELLFFFFLSLTNFLVCFIWHKKRAICVISQGFSLDDYNMHS